MCPREQDQKQEILISKWVNRDHIYPWVQSYEAGVDTVQVALNQLAQMLMATGLQNMLWSAKCSQALSKYLCSYLSEHHTIINMSADTSLWAALKALRLKYRHNLVEQLIKRSSVVLFLCIFFIFFSKDCYYKKTKEIGATSNNENPITHLW